MFRDINEASAVLLDKNKRDKYDQGYDLEDINSGKADMGGFGGGGGMGGMDPNDIFSMFMGGGGMGGRRAGGGGGGFPHSHAGANQGFTFRFG